jgi:hypothetical protein
MIKTESGTEYCTSCVHFGYCMVYWGVDCKRQGGKRIPRMKPTPVDIIEKNARPRIEPIQIVAHMADTLKAVNKQKSDKPKNTRKPDMFKKIVEIFEPIRTKVANW